MNEASDERGERKTRRSEGEGGGRERERGMGGDGEESGVIKL